MNKIKRKQAYRKGHDAEMLACQYLQSHGWQIIKQRYKTPYGEIDIIARRDDWCIFVEVKARKDVDAALYAVTQRQQQRIAQAALHFVADYSITDNMRFDVIAVSATHAITHIQHAWDMQ